MVDMTAHEQPFTVLVNHWPSRYGGRAQSEWKRVIAANTAAAIVDSITAGDPGRDIIMMGDLNDEPNNRSVSDELDAAPVRMAPQGESGDDDYMDVRLFDLAASDDRLDTIGTYLYNERWQILDHIIVSPGLLDHVGLSLLDRSMTIFATPFLRDTHPSAPMNPPRRTYIHGTLYIGGTSDHFPVYERILVLQ
jgi:predicted extracellular nuclease